MVRVSACHQRTKYILKQEIIIPSAHYKITNIYLESLRLYTRGEREHVAHKLGESVAIFSAQHSCEPFVYQITVAHRNLHEKRSNESRLSGRLSKPQPQIITTCERRPYSAYVHSLRICAYDMYSRLLYTHIHTHNTHTHTHTPTHNLKHKSQIFR